MDLSIGKLMDENACYATLVHSLHPAGITCPRCNTAEHLAVHRRHRPPVLDYRCASCRRVFNAFTNSALQGSKRRPSHLILILRGIAQGVLTAQQARKLEGDRPELHKFRQRLQEAAYQNRDRMPLDDEVLEADEAYQNAGERRGPAS